MKLSTPTLTEYVMLLESLNSLTPEEKRLAERHLCRTNLLFLLHIGLGRDDILHPWLIARCHEVQQNPNGYIDLWAREHYKSTIITFGLTILDILASHGDLPLTDREVTVGIFSHMRPSAKGFLRQIKFEFETNEYLRRLFPDILWAKPDSEAPKWSEDDGLIVKRKSNPKEATVEAWGLVDGMPTGKHYLLRVYDDVVTEKSITTPEMILKTTTAWELSDNLGAEGGSCRVIGTRYHHGDTYKTMIERKTVKPRIYAATEDGTETGTPVLLTVERLREKRRAQGPYTFGSQMLQNPTADAVQGFRREWLVHYDGVNDGKGTRIFILVDPANDKKKKSDWTAMFVVGIGADANYYVLDMIRDRLNLTERADTLFSLHKKWKPAGVGYEEYGMQADIQHIQDRQNRENYRFVITPLGGTMAKNERIRRLLPPFESGKIFLPRTRYYTNYEKNTVDLVAVFTEEEYLAFPVAEHDDMLDCLARILDEALYAGPPPPAAEPKIERYSKDRRKAKAHTPWGR